MKKVGFIGSFDKTDLILYIAKILVAAGNRVMVVDATVTQKTRYVVPVIQPTNAYVTEFEGIDVAVGFANLDSIKMFLGMPVHAELPYDIVLFDIDNYVAMHNFNINNNGKNYFVTGFDLYSLKKGLEILSQIPENIFLTKVLFSRTATKEEDDYLNHLALGYKIEWDNERIYFPFELGDETIIAENQRVSKIKFKKLSDQYKEGLIYIAQQILENDNYNQFKKLLKQLEKNV